MLILVPVMVYCINGALKADQVWLITDTKFGFVSYQTKNIVDRVMPLVTMNLHFLGKQMRHVPRYKKNPDWGVIYAGEGDKEYLSKWCERVAINFAAKSLGAYRIDEIEETVKKFAGPEYFPLSMRVMLQIMFKTVAKKKYVAVANEWGCKKPIDYKPWGF